jgi:hypothetical protein
LSYSGIQGLWIQGLRNTDLIEKELEIPSDEIFDYRVNQITQGQYRIDVKDEIRKSDVFIAVIDEEYPNRRDTVYEFNEAYSQFFRNAKPLPGKTFGLIFLDPGGLNWFERNRNDPRYRFPEDTAYLRMFKHGEKQHPFVGGNPNGPVIDDLQGFLRNIRDNLMKMIGDRTVLMPPKGPVPVVLCGHPFEPTPPPPLSSAFEDINGLLHGLATHSDETMVLDHGWANVASNDAKRLLVLAARGAIFLVPVDKQFGTVVVATPTILGDLLRVAAKLRPSEEARSPFENAHFVYWMPAGVENQLFLERSSCPEKSVGPYFRIGSPTEIAGWLVDRISPGRPAPPIHYESAPLDRAMRQLASQLTTALNGICRPPEPTARSFIPNERPFSDELNDIVNARGGIFITHSLDVEATCDDIPSDLLQKILRYVDSLEEFCAANRLKLEQIYRVALVRQRKQFWKGPWSTNVGDEDARLAGWRFLGIRKSDAGDLEMDADRVAYIVKDVRTLIAP